MSIPSRLEKFSLLFIALVMPLAFYPGAEDAFRLVQLAALNLGVAGLLAGWAGECPALPFNPRRHDALVLLFFAWRILSRLVQGWDSGIPLFLAEQSSYFILYAWASTRLASSRLADRLVFYLLFGVSLAAAYGLAQTLGLDPLSGLATGAGFGARSFSSLGNPDFFGGHLVLLIPLVLAPWLTGAFRSGRSAWLYGALLALLLLSLLWSQTRGAWLGFAASVIILTAGLGAEMNWKRLGGLAACGILALALFSFPNPLNRAGLRSFGRVAEGVSGKDLAGKGRKFMARAALEAAIERPVFGWGAGRFTGAYLEAQAGLLKLPEFAGQPFRFTNDAHNDLLQIAAESGFPALFVFIAILFLTCRTFWTRRTVLANAMLAGIIGLCVHGLFNFPLSIVPTTAFFWLFLGWASALDRNPEAETKPYPKAASRAVFAASVCLNFLALRALYANTVFHQGMDSLALKQPLPALPFLTKARALDQGDYRYAFQTGRALDQLGRFPEAEASFMKAVGILPQYPEAWAGLGLSQGKAGDLAGAETSCLKALRYNPRSLENLGNLGKVYYLSGKKARAVETYLLGIQRDKGWVEGHFNLGAIYFNEGQKALALEQFQAALALDPSHAGAKAMVEKMKGSKASKTP